MRWRLRWRRAAFACARRLRRRPSGLRVPPVAKPSVTGAAERASRTITNAIPPSSSPAATSPRIIDVLVPELDSCVRVLAVFVAFANCEGICAAPVAGVVTVGTLPTTGRDFGAPPPEACPPGARAAAFPAPTADFGDVPATLPAPFAGFAADGAAGEAGANGLPASLAPSAAAGNRTSSVSAADAHTAIRVALICRVGRIDRASPRG